MATKKITKLAKTVNAQVNPNLPARELWKNCDKALTETTKTYASSYATLKTVKGKEVYNHPWVLTAHKFALGLPSNAYVKSVKFLVRMRAVGKQHKDWKVPVARFNIYGSAYKKEYDKGGWDDGIYYDGLKKYLSSSWQTYTYTMGESDVKKGGFKISNFNAEVMGVDLIFYDTKFQSTNKGTGSAEVDVAWVKVEVEYEIPTYKISYQEVSLEDRLMCLKATFTNSSKANGGTQVLDVDIPWGTELVSPTSTESGFNPTTRKWTVNAKPNAKAVLNFCIAPFLEGTSTLKIGNDTTKRFPYEYETPVFLDEGYDDITLSLDSEPHKNHIACLNIAIEGISSDNQLGLTTTMNKGFTNKGWTLVNGSSGVSLDYQSGGSVELTVPQNERFTAYLRYCFIPTATGSYVANVESDDMVGRSKILEFTVANPYVYHIGQGYSTGVNNANITTDYIKINTHRVASEIGTNATVIPVRSDENDAVMHISPCTLHMKKWNELDYIGCVPLEHLHFDPKSTYKDKLLDTHYKNKRYMGKQLASDEDITLNVRLHPQDVTTIQGLIDMDKPIPINANHRSFEGDSLNHRGWCEIYGITVTRTNPHWYKCDIDVKYLTHNLNTRFKIDKGNKIYNQPISSVMSEVFERGDKLAEDITQDFFSVVTDGTYMYNTSEVVEVDYLTNEGYEVVKNGTNAQYTDSAGVTHTIDTLANFVAYLEENNYDVIVPTTNLDTVKVKALLDVPTNQRNMFSIDNNQYIDIQTRNPLGVASEVSFEWANVVSDELRENNLERIIELVDKNTNEPVFKYQYSDFIYDYDDTTETPTIESVRATPIAYVRKNGDWITQSEEIELDTIIGTGGIIDDSDTATPIDTSVDDDYQDDNTDTSELIIGSTIHFILDNHTLQVIDEGFNSREFETSKMELEGETYYWRTRWVNKNSDGESNDMVCFFDFSVSDTIIDTQYADKYSKLIVSPFPVSNKKLVFSREAEEGTVYYYEDDNEEFSYLIEPYYQYMNGTDLVTDSGISIFNLNYGYKLVYIQNGLVRLGFDRIDGRLYLGKYDAKSDTYVTTTHMHLDKYSDINVKSITDDKIEIQASDSIFTIWRGHPYIMINHPTEDIIIDTQFNKVWAEKVGGDDSSELPVYWDLMNNANILPSCVGGQKEIRSSCVEVDASDLARTATTLSYATGTDWSDIEVGTDKTITLTSDNLSMSDTIDIGSGHCAFGDYTVEIGHDYSVVTDVAIIGDSIIQNGDSGILKAKVTGYNYTPIADKSVDFIQKNKQLFFDKAVSGYKNTDWGYTTTDIQISTDTTGTTISNTGSTGRTYWANYPATSKSTGDEWNNPLVVEVDILSASGTGTNVALQLVKGSSAVSRNMSQLGVVNGGHIKIVCDGETAKYYVNDSETPNYSQNWTETDFAVRFYVVNGYNFKYKNFKITCDDKVYPITDTLFSDTGVTGSANPNWYDNNYGTVSVGSDGTLLTSTDTTNFLMHNASNSSHTSSDQYIWNAPFVVEFDVVSQSGTGTDTQFQVYSDETIKNWATGLNGVGHYKAIVFDNNQRLYKDGELQTNFQSYSLPNCRITLRVRNNVSLKYKNFKVYEIAENSITDTNGIATCQIVGDGSGLEQYSAKCENIESEPITVIDGIFYDNATLAQNRNWDYQSVNTELTRLSEYTQLKRTSTATSFGSLEMRADSNYTLKDADLTSIAFEFDIQWIGSHTESIITLRGGSTQRVSWVRSNGLSDGKWHHLKIEIDGLTAHTWVDGTAISDKTISDTWNKFQLDIRADAITNFKNFVVYPLESEEPTPVEPVPTTLTLTNTKDILSAYNSESTTLTATVLDENGDAISGKSVVFKKGSSTLDTVQTNSSGVATYTYTADGSGDVTITVTCESLTQTQAIEDCIYYNATEKTRTGTQAHSLYDTNLSVTLPTNAEISFDCYVADNNNYDYRYWLMPKSQFTGNTNYPSYAPSYFDRRVDAINTGRRVNGTNTSKGNYQLTTSNQYATIKYVKTGTEFSMYADGTLCYTETLSWIDDYTDYTLSMMKWSGNKTMYMKNVKFKKL